MGDVFGMDDAQLVAWVAERNRALTVNPDFKIMMTFVSPDRLLHFMGERWASWHRGSTIRVHDAGPGGGYAELRFPPRLFDRLGLDVLAAIYAVVFEQSQAPHARAVVTAATDDSATFHVSW